MIVGIVEDGHTVLAYSFNDNRSVAAPDDRTLADNVHLYALPAIPGGILGFACDDISADVVRWVIAEEWKDLSVATINNAKESIFQAMKKYGTTEDSIDNAFIVAQEGTGELIGFSASGVVRKVDDYFCYGCGDEKEFSLARLKRTVGMPAEARITDLFDFLGKFRKEDYYPVALMDTQSCALKMIGKGGSV